MGFSLTLVRIRDADQADADREGIAAFLAERGLAYAPGPSLGSFVDGAGDELLLDGARTDLRVDPLDQDEPVGGYFSHAHVTPEECQFVYDLCVAGGFLVVNVQGDPMYIVPAANHAPEELDAIGADEGEVARVSSGPELQAVLSGAFGTFAQWRDKVLSTSETPPEPGAQASG